MRVAGQQASNSGNIFSAGHTALTIPWRRVALYATIALGFFLAGLVPMWLKANDAIEQRDAAQRGVRLAQLENTLAAAMIDVHRGDYEPARQRTSEFYTNLRRQVDAENRSLFSPAQREGLKSLLAERDQLITLLARSDPAATERLYNVYLTYNKVTSNGG